MHILQGAGTCRQSIRWGAYMHVHLSCTARYRTNKGRSQHNCLVLWPLCMAGTSIVCHCARTAAPKKLRLVRDPSALAQTLAQVWAVVRAPFECPPALSHGPLPLPHGDPPAGLATHSERTACTLAWGAWSPRLLLPRCSWGIGLCVSKQL